MADQIAEELGEKIREVSIAEFFEKNRHILGYENPTKSLFTVVKELVDNALDAAIEAKILPEVKVVVKPLANNRFKVKVEDNGPGLPPSKVPIAFGKFLVGSKFYRLRQSIGTQGIGAKGAILYAQLTTGKPAKITTFYKGKAHEFELMIDVLKNEPHVLKHEVKETRKKHGLSVELQVEGRYVSGHQSIKTYLKFISIANPYARIIFDSPNGKYVFERAINKLPPLPKEIKPHPYGVELGKLKRMLKLSPYKNLVTFFTKEFSRVSKSTALKICKLARIDWKKKPSLVTHQEAEKLHKAMQMVKLLAPPTNCLSPLNEEMLVEGLKKEFPAEYYVAVVRKPSVYRGNPFQVQVALAYGEGLKEILRDQALLLRFANHTPLLYNQAECAITKAVLDVDWRSYGLSQSANSLPQAPLVILVDFISVWIPYTSEGKHAIANYPEIIKEIKLALQEAGRRLAKFVKEKRRLHEMKLRRNLFESYSIVFAEYLSKLTEKDAKKIKEKLEILLKKGKFKFEKLEKEKEIKEKVEIVEVK